MRACLQCWKATSSRGCCSVAAACSGRLPACLLSRAPRWPPLAAAGWSQKPEYVRRLQALGGELLPPRPSILSSSEGAPGSRPPSSWPLASFATALSQALSLHVGTGAANEAVPLNDTGYLLPFTPVRGRAGHRRGGCVCWCGPPGHHHRSAACIHLLTPLAPLPRRCVQRLLLRATYVAFCMLVAILVVRWRGGQGGGAVAGGGRRAAAAGERSPTRCHPAAAPPASRSPSSAHWWRWWARPRSGP